MPDIALSYQRAQRVIPTGVGIVEMDVIVNFSNGTGALTATRLTNGTHGANWGTWHDYHNGAPEAPNTHSIIEDHAVRFPGRIRVGGVLYDGSEGQGLTFDFSTGSRDEYDAFQLNYSTSITNAIALYLVQFATTLGDNSFNNDTWTFNGGNYTIGQYSHNFADVRQIYPHTEGDIGPGIPVPSGWVIVCLLHDGDGLVGQMFLQDAVTLEIIGASYVVHTHPIDALIYSRLQDYLLYPGAGPGQIRWKLVALRSSDMTWPPYPITVPPTTSVACSQTGTDELTLTWASVCMIFSIERNVNGGGWTVLDSAFYNRSVNVYVDSTVSDGQSVQYRVTGQIGSQSSVAVTSNTVVVDN